MVPSERVDHPRAPGDRRESAEPHRHRGQPDKHRAGPFAERRGQNRDHRRNPVAARIPRVQHAGDVGDARVNASRSRYPTTLETATAITMLHGTRRLGSTVSSDTLADASYPVNVHCACSRPTTNAHQYGQPCVLNVIRAKKNPIGRVGANRNTAPTMAMTPTMWTVTLKSLSRATSRMPK